MSKHTDPVRQSYEKWPYPTQPLFAQVRRQDLWQIHLEYLQKKVGLPPSVGRPHIWIAGCGTFQPYLFAHANPRAEILATDLSHHSLQIAQRRTRFYGKQNVTYHQLDLTDFDAFPNQTFDYIECYGVLMCLPNPTQVLTELGKRLKPHGLLRLMVYPQYSRRRIFQIQRLAQLMQWTFHDNRAPKKLKFLMDKLNDGHPLSRTFFSYSDIGSDAGIVDAFIHPSDAGISALSLKDWVNKSDLELRYCFQRPQAQPNLRMQQLGYSVSPWWGYHYLDLWQELRANYVICLSKKATPWHPSQPSPHGLFHTRSKHLNLRDKAHLWGAQIWGGSYQTQTEAHPRKLTASQIRKLQSDRETSELCRPQWDLDLAQKHFDGEQEIEMQTSLPAFFKSPPPLDLPGLPNPLFEGFWQAYTYPWPQNAQGGALFGSLEDQLLKWKGHTTALEDTLTPWGLTPYATYPQFAAQIKPLLGLYQKASTIEWDELPLKSWKKKEKDLFHLLGPLVPSSLTLAQKKELWTLLLGHSCFFLESA